MSEPMDCSECGETFEVENESLRDEFEWECPHCHNVLNCTKVEYWVTDCDEPLTRTDSDE